MYANNADKQRAYRQKLREKQLQQQIETAQKTKSTQSTPVNLEKLIESGFNGQAHTVAEAKQAYTELKAFYLKKGTNILLEEINDYSYDNDRLPCGIEIGYAIQFLDVCDPHIRCSICDFSRSILEDNCPECQLKLSDYKAWKAHHKKAGVPS
jgi:hypothetical protein